MTQAEQIAHLLRGIGEVKLTITAHRDGRVTIVGPIEDRCICEALLKGGADALREYHAAKGVLIVHG